MSISRIQVTGNAAAADESIDVAISATSIGDLIIVWASTGGNSVSTFTITDNKGGGSNTYIPITGYANVDLSGGSHSETDWFGYAVDTGGGVTNISVVHNAAGGSTFASVGIYRSTIGFTSPFDKTNKGVYDFGQTSFSSGSSGTLTRADSVAIGFAQCTNDPGTVTPGGGFTQRDYSALLDGRRHFFADQIVSVTTALTFSMTCSATDAVANIVTLMEDAGAAAQFTVTNMNAYVRFGR